MLVIVGYDKLDFILELVSYEVAHYYRWITIEVM
jgi:hypothetical protein